MTPSMCQPLKLAFLCPGQSSPWPPLPGLCVLPVSQLERCPTPTTTHPSQGSAHLMARGQDQLRQEQPGACLCHQVGWGCSFSSDLTRDLTRAPPLLLFFLEDSHSPRVPMSYLYIFTGHSNMWLHDYLYNFPLSNNYILSVS